MNNVEVEPLYKTIYFQGDKNPYNLRIKEGSGQFSVSLNDSSIAEIIHVEREVKIVPYKTGSLKITIIDSELPESHPVFAELKISDVASLRLESDGYLIEEE